ncbi:zinc-binding dehydrogenase [Pseudonocardia sp. NPDC046786]|uniref:zinc-binding dehydrogenase n=1 Tax=Pseudonocardia sp. NPDC046786 TaxID=3155471 RepID=UPI0033F8378B
MFAVFAERADFDDPVSAVRIGEQPPPATPDGWIKVSIKAAGLNWHDLWTLRGVGMWPIVPPVVLGVEGAGHLESGEPVVVYPLVTDPDWRGDETLDPTRHTFSEKLPGTFAEHVMVPRRNVLPLPEGLGLVEASVLGTAWLTAYRLLFTKSGLVPGQTMLVQGASGGVATALIQLGRAAGIRVWVTGRDIEKRKLAERLGAHRTFRTGGELPEQVDAVFDTAGAATWAHSIDSTRPGGTVLSCGAATGATPETALRRVFRDQISIRGSYLGTRDEMLRMISFLHSAQITPVVGRTLPMQDAREGFSDMWHGRTAGKIVFTR